MLVLALMACRQADPALVEEREVIDLWRRGESLLAEGRPSDARVALADALERRPGDPLLMAWSARAAAEDGDLEDAIALLDAAVERSPSFGMAYYDRGAYHGRLGNVEALCADMEAALALDALPARDVLDDPDIAPFLGEPCLSFLPLEPLSILLEVPEGPLFIGTRFAVGMRVAGGYDLPLSVTLLDAPVQGVSLVRVVEDAVPSTAGTLRDLTWTFEVTGAGTATFGPFSVWSGARRAHVPARVVETVAPPGHVGPDVHVTAFSTPRELAGARYPPALWEVGGRTRVLVGPAERAVLPAEITTIPYELREAGQAMWTLHDVPGADVDAQIQRNGVTVLPSAGDPP